LDAGFGTLSTIGPVASTRHSVAHSTRRVVVIQPRVQDESFWKTAIFSSTSPDWRHPVSLGKDVGYDTINIFHLLTRYGRDLSDRRLQYSPVDAMFPLIFRE
jgi:hypothetical protein